MAQARNPPSVDQNRRGLANGIEKFYFEEVNSIKRLGVAGVLVALVVCTVAGPRIFTQLWTRAVSAYSDWRYDPGDPRNPHYVLWKRGLSGNMNLDTAMAAFYLDPDRDQLIRGATEDQLKTRFGYVRPLEQVSPTYRQCFGQSWTPKGDSALFLRDTPFMVVMDHQRGSTLVLCKGY